MTYELLRTRVRMQRAASKIPVVVKTVLIAAIVVAEAWSLYYLASLVLR